jgi:hypothetical protein
VYRGIKERAEAAALVEGGNQQIMKSKPVGILALVNLVLVTLWVVTLIWGMARSGAVETFDEALDQVHDHDGLYLVTYANAVFFTLSTTMLFGALYAYFRPVAPSWSAVGIVLVPVYSAFNLFVYASQITIVPQLVELQSLPGTDAAATFFLGQMIQIWPGSAIGIVNGLAYAILGIPSIIYGLLLWRGNRLRRAAGVLLVLNALACFAWLIGLVGGVPLLEIGTVVGGFLYWLALFPLTLGFLRIGTYKEEQ